MPFEKTAHPRKKIAVIGGGISGMGAALMLGADHDVTLIEAEPRLGGHARTIVAGKNGDQPVDTGFIVFNYANYPLLTRLFDQLNVPVTKSDMSFGASLRGGRLEYGLADLRAVFAQTRNAFRPKYLGMLRDVMRFNARALATAQDRDMTIGDLLDRLGTGDWFRDYYLLPLSGAIWSTPKDKILDFPAYAMIRFFENHALLSHTGQHQWYTVQGGSVEYVRRVQSALVAQGTQMRLGQPVIGVRRPATGPELRMKGGDWERFDEVIFAIHSDQTLAMITDPTEQETRVLGAVRYQPNRITLHADDNVMPRNTRAWASWNYREHDAADPRGRDEIDLTYWMNRLQPIPKSDPMFVTLNATRDIDPAKIYDEVTLHHPVYDLAALAAQEEVAQMNSQKNSWFAGAWVKNGFHEDGLASAADVVAALTGASAQHALSAKGANLPGVPAMAAE